MQPTRRMLRICRVYLQRVLFRMLSDLEVWQGKTSHQVSTILRKSRGRVPRRTICTAATSASHHLAPPTTTMTESLVAVRVELPTYSLSFSIQVHICATVLDVKHAISASCTGQPRVEGQRIIWRGRYLEDQEKISDIWKVTKNLRLL
jgi:hypothetical protein